jgi:NADH-quinone oxidoreductase subunit K
MPLYLDDYLNTNSFLFCTGIVGLVFNRKNILIIVMSIELMLLGVNLNFIIFSLFLDDMLGQVFSLFILSVAAAEACIGLAVLVAYYRIRGTITVKKLQAMRG